MPRDEQYLVEIVEAARTVERWLTHVDAAAWTDDEILRSAVLLKLITIGEASRAVSADLRDRHTTVQWRDASAFRNFAVHEYFAIEWDRVWSIARRSIPDFARGVLAVVRVEYPGIAARLDTHAAPPDRTDG